MSDSSYESALQDEARDLVAAARSGELPEIGFRDTEIEKALEQLDARRSVLLTGPPGIGKTAVVFGIARAMADRNRGGIRQLSTATFMSGTRYIGEWQTKTTRIAEAAEATKTVLYIDDAWNLPRVGRTNKNDASLLDALRPFIEAGRIQLLAETTPELLLKMQRFPGFVNLFVPIPVAQLEDDAVDGISARGAAEVELDIDETCRRSLVDLTSRLSPARPQPGPALQLLAQVADYQAQKRAIGEEVPIAPQFVERVFSIYSGLPMFIVSRTETMPGRDIRAWFEDRIVGQRDAIEAVVEAIALFKSGLHDPSKPLGTFLFVGPTGVGKTELARALAEFLFGSKTRLLRFDLSEFKDYHSFELLAGKPDDPSQEARLIDPVRAQPFQIVLFDELEKAHANVWDLLLPVLDEGRLSPPGGKAVSFRNTLIIATSNVGARESARKLGFGAGADEAGRSRRVQSELEREFRPEFLNRFQHVVVFHPLSEDQVRTVARQELRRILAREGITGRNLVVDVADEALDLVIKRGFDERYGARALKREIQRGLVLPLAMTIMERRVEPGTVLKLVERDGQIKVRTVETAESRASKRQREPIKLPEGDKVTRTDLVNRSRQLAERIETLASELDESFLNQERERILELRRQPEFWNYSQDAALALRDLDRITAALARLDRLRARSEDISALVERADLRRELKDAANRLAQLDGSVTGAHRELVVLGRMRNWDALVEIRPIGESGRLARDFVAGVYLDWARDRRMGIDWLREPRADDEPVWLALRGNYASGYLDAERGMHRVRDGELRGVAAVRVAPWTDDVTRPQFERHRALKETGQFGGTVRSRLECAGQLVLQNARTLADNRELAGELAASWAAAPAAPDEIVRRYDLSPFLIRDALTDTSSGRPDALSPRLFHQLLCRRVDAMV